MAAQPVGIGERFQQATKYRRGKMAGGFLDWRRKPEEFKEYPRGYPKISPPECRNRWWGASLGGHGQETFPQGFLARGYLR